MFASPNAIGICKDKLLFITDGSEGYGTVMSYDLINNKLEATGYDTGLGNGSTVLNSITIGDKCYFLVVDTGNIDVLPDDDVDVTKYINEFQLDSDDISVDDLDTDED